MTDSTRPLDGTILKLYDKDGNIEMAVEIVLGDSISVDTGKSTDALAWEEFAQAADFYKENRSEAFNLMVLDCLASAAGSNLKQHTFIPKGGKSKSAGNKLNRVFAQVTGHQWCCSDTGWK